MRSVLIFLRKTWAFSDFIIFIKTKENFNIYFSLFLETVKLLYLCRFIMQFLPSIYNPLWPSRLNQTNTLCASLVSCLYYPLPDVPGNYYRIDREEGSYPPAWPKENPSLIFADRKASKGRRNQHIFPLHIHTSNAWSRGWCEGVEHPYIRTRIRVRASRSSSLSRSLSYML